MHEVARLDTQVASLQMKIVSEDKVVEGKTADLLAEWEKEKPVEVLYHGTCSSL